MAVSKRSMASAATCPARSLSISTVFTGRFGFPTFATSSLTQRDDLLDLTVGGLEGLEHLVLGQLVRSAFDHHDGVGSACHDQVEVRGLESPSDRD